jgi:hypothetical protein
VAPVASNTKTWYTFDLEKSVQLTQSAELVPPGEWQVVFARESRHAVALIRDSSGGHWFLKQRGMHLAGQCADLRGEVTASKVLSLLAADGAQLLPRLIGAVNHEELLVFEGVEDAIDIRSVVLRDGRQPIQLSGVASSLGSFLAQLHGIPTANVNAEMRRLECPIRSFDSIPLERFADSPRSYHEFIALMQVDERLGQSLNGLRDSWQENVFIHGDLKLDNIMQQTKPGRDSRVFLVDWELSGAGDPHWDIGCLISSYLYTRLELLSQVAQDGVLATELSKGIMDAIRALFASYSTSHLVGPRVSLSRAMQWAAGALLMRTEILLPLRRELAAIDLAAIHLAAQILLGEPELFAT